MIPPIANRFVAGEEPEAALAHVAEVNDRGVGGILNLLGEHYDDRPDADADADAYCRLVDGIAERGLDASVSVKPSQIGIDLPTTAFEENLARIVDRAIERDVFVWVDMEDHETTDQTLDAVCEQAERHPHGVGLAIQANLKRTEADLARLADVPAAVRLVKGAYDEPAAIAYREQETVDEKYREYLEFLFREFDEGVAVGSHDPAMLEYARELHEEYGTPFEIQMLMGVREDAQFDLAEEYDVYQYAPYGPKWFQYFYRRVRERKKNALFALRAVVGV
ncbi:proline dehydrogenase [Halarchaeum grantii]|uniref:proline dehydrogenase n=1 Tax=Halarchaeum grantii TaxID=1193105 RepID=A0A830FE97_9EURY|nr:proline dehydrogenase family protein [Halarchaeum grantii]GGL38095.1 proline dehydrogenase [Halarchaeum grantii]